MIFAEFAQTHARAVGDEVEEGERPGDAHAPSPEPVGGIGAQPG
jgi:hypothetical protein